MSLALDDLEVAAAIVALEHNLLTPSAAASIIAKARKSNYRSIADLLLDAVEETAALRIETRFLKRLLLKFEIS